MIGVEDSSVIVVGSVNMDLVVRSPHIPLPGETILGTSLVESPGGKGANQAVAAAKLGGHVAMVGCVGADAYGDALVASLDEAGARTGHMLTRGERSGVALIEVADNGENNIVVVPGANALLTPADVEAAIDAMPRARFLLLQLEVPLATVTAAARRAKARGLVVVLDPAPAQPLADELLALVDILAPNQGEAAALAGLAAACTAEEAPAVAARLHARGPQTVLVKLGAGGVLVSVADGVHVVPGLRVGAVDTTAAGDCLAGALVTSLAEGTPLIDAVRFANAAAALSTTKHGAQVAMPTRIEVDRLLAKHFD